MRIYQLLCLCVLVILILTGCGSSGGNDTSSGFSGTWAGTYSGTTFSYNVTQIGSIIVIARTAPLATGITYSGTASGDTAVINTYGNGTYMGYTTWSKTSSNTMSVYLNSCIPTSGFSCGASNGITLYLARQ